MDQHDLSNQRLRLYPENHRDTGAEIPDLVYKSKEPLKLVNEVDFAQDGLFCEWAYDRSGQEDFRSL